MLCGKYEQNKNISRLKTFKKIRTFSLIKIFLILILVWFLCINSPFRSSHRRCSVRKSILKNFSEPTGIHVCHSLHFNKVAGKLRLWHRCFPVNFVKFLRLLFLQNTSRQLLLTVSTWFYWSGMHRNLLSLLKLNPIILSLTNQQT